MKNLKRQQGMTLIMALIMLMVITMLALTSFNMGKTNLVVVGNMQQRDEALSAAHEVIEEVMSDNRFSDAADDALSDPCGGDENTRCVDTNGDGQSDVTVTLNPPPGCVKAKTIRNTEIDVENDEERGCVLGNSGNFGDGSNTNASMCSNTVWQITAVAADNRTGASVTVVQGVSTKVDTNDVLTQCP